MFTYPVNLDLSLSEALIVGAGGVGTRKAKGLLKAGASVVVVAPAACEEFSNLKELYSQRLTYKKRPYQTEDLDGKLLVFVATGNKKVDLRVIREAKERGILVNAATQPEKSDFSVPSVIRRGDFLLTIATGGASPALSKKVRKELEEEYGPEYEEYVSLLGKVREIALKHAAENSCSHTSLLRSLVNSDILERLLNGEHLDPDTVYKEYLFKQ